MTEQEHERPLTRRELRMREQAERAGVEATDEAAAGEPSVVAEEPVEQAAATPNGDGASIEVEIDPLNADGTPRTRREMRELREAAIAEILAEREAAAPENASDAPETRPTATPVAATPDADADAPTEALRVEDLLGPDAPEAVIESEIELDAPTEAFTLEDILDAAEPTSPTGDAEAVANLFGEGDAPEAESEAVEADEVDLDAEVRDEAPIDATSIVDVDPDLAAADLDASAVDADELATEADTEDVAGAADAEIAAEAPLEAELADENVKAVEEDTSKDTAGYSFPDIKPPEEWRSVFDDPSRAASITAPGESGDFDDLISRAVAQEGSTGGTGTSALILPSHPGDTGSLTGPLGATGELFVTGSIELPKSMGETGGHSGIHDSIDYDPFLTGDHTESIAAASDSGPMPVSAMSAVSARRRPEVPVVAEPTKDRSKVPLILALSGGGLIVVVAGVVVYAATQGLFG